MSVRADKFGGPAVTRVALLGAVLAMSSAAGRADEPLHRQIDSLIAERAGGPMAPPADDYEFLRRLTLDLAGRVPRPEEVERFLADPPQRRRELAIDRRLASHEFSLRMAELLDVMLMERRGGDEHWGGFLRQAMADNLPWDELIRHLVNPQADDPSRRGAAAFIVQRLQRYGQNPSDMPGLVRDTGRLFLGMDVQCAQCHDHLFIDQYKQRHYQGLFAFLGQAEIRRDKPFPAVSQKLLMEKVEFASVFDPQPQATGPRLPGRDELQIPQLPEEQRYEVPPDRKTRFPGVPKFQPLAELARELTAEDNHDFAVNFANRMWWVMMGRGLVEPLDQRHADNPPSHPELLELLAHEARTQHFEIRWLIRELALSDTYQRSGRLPDGADAAMVPPASYRVALQRPLSAEQLCRSLHLVAATPQDPLPPLESAAEPLWPLDPELLESFRGAFANPPKEPELDYRPSVKAALFWMNSPQVLDRIRPHAGGAIARLASVDDDAEAVEAAYLRCLSRPPSDKERQEAVEFLASQDDRGQAMGHLFWALTASTEFLVNH